MSGMLLAAIVCLFLGLGMVVLEIFVPSGGLLGTLAVILLLVAVVLAFFCGTSYGLAFIGALLVLVPLIVMGGLKVWPHTPMGKRMLLSTPTGDEVLPDDPQRQRLKRIVGQVGRARSPMLPSGIVDVDGVSVDAVSEGVAVEPGTLVRVLEVRGNRVLVRPIEPDSTEVKNPYAELNQPIDSLGLRPLEDPPA